MEDERADEAYTILKNAVNNKKDASAVFGDYIASKHRKYSSYTKNVIEHAINTILYEADMGKYNDPSATIQQQTATELHQPQSNRPLTTQQFQSGEYQPDILVVHSETSSSSQMSDIISYVSSFSDESYSSSNH